MFRSLAALLIVIATGSALASDLVADDFTEVKGFVEVTGHIEKLKATVHVECWKSTGLCTVTRAFITPTGKLELAVFHNTIRNWTAKVVIARNDDPASYTMTIDLGAKVITEIQCDPTFGCTTYSWEHGPIAHL